MQVVNFQCGHCTAVMGVNAEFLGQEVRCPHCQGVVVAPQSATPTTETTDFEYHAPPPASSPNVDLLDQPPAATAPYLNNYHGPDEIDHTTPVTQTAVRPERESTKRSQLAFIILVSLISYSTLTTIYILVKILGPRTVAYPLLEAMPDVEGDNPGVRRGQAKPLSDAKVAELNKLEVPEKLRVPLGGTLRIGDLEVKPTKVERRKVGRFIETSKRAELTPHDALVLTLELRNLAADYRFVPLDNYFDRKWDRKGRQPMTLIQAGEDRFIGGPAAWIPMSHRKSDKQDRQWLDGPGRRNGDDDYLKPGQMVEAIVATDGTDPLQEAFLKRHTGPLLWRVQLRRGLVDLGNRRVPATAVIGVEFSSSDYQ